MPYDNTQVRAQGSGAYQGGPQQGDGWPGGPQPGGPNAGFGAGPGPGAQRRIDALDVLEGVLTDGFSFSNITRIARASGSNFWVGAALGAGLVVLMNRPDVRAAFGSIFRPAGAPASPTEPAPQSPPPTV